MFPPLEVLGKYDADNKSVSDSSFSAKFHSLYEWTRDRVMATFLSGDFPSYSCQISTCAWTVLLCHAILLMWNMLFVRSYGIWNTNTLTTNPFKGEHHSKTLVHWSAVDAVPKMFCMLAFTCSGCWTFKKQSVTCQIIMRMHFAPSWWRGAWFLLTSKYLYTQIYI